MTTVVLSYPEHGDLVIEADDEGNIINQHWSYPMITDTMSDPTGELDDYVDQYDQPDVEAPLTAEQIILDQYHAAIDLVERVEGSLAHYREQLRLAKAEKSRLYKVASVIDPTLKQTRPKSA